MGKGDTWCYTLFGMTEFIRLQQPGVVNLCDFCQFCEFFRIFDDVCLFVAASMVGLPLESRISLAFSVRMKAMDPPGTTGPAKNKKTSKGQRRSQNCLSFANGCLKKCCQQKLARSLLIRKKFISSKELKHLRRICNLCPFQLRVNCISDALLSTH